MCDKEDVLQVLNSNLNFDEQSEVSRLSKDPDAGFVVKVAFGGSAGRGVSREWSIEQCERETGQRCFKQEYFKGPWEARLVRNNYEWEVPVRWPVPWPQDGTLPPVESFSSVQVASLQEKIAKTFPLTPFLSVDCRIDSDGTVNVVELNGGYGTTFQYLLKKSPFLFNLLQWAVPRVSAGLWQLSLQRIWALICLGATKFYMRHAKRGTWL